MRKTLAVAALAAITFGAPLAIEQAFTAQATTTIQAKGHGHSGGGHSRAHHERAGYCVDDAPHICLPGNDEHKPAACYDDGGVIVDVWPCEAWQPSDGYQHGDGTVTYDPDETVYAIGYVN